MNFLENEPMSAHTSFKVGGPAKYFVKADSIEEIAEAITYAKAQNLPSFILGKGSNLLVSDKGFEGVVVQLGRLFSEISQKEGGIFCAGAAVPLARLSRNSISKGFAGIHKLAGIPGSLGGAVYMNAGAYGQEINQTCVEVQSLGHDGIVRVRTAAECGFGYRHSVFQELAANDIANGKCTGSACSTESAEIILSATFQLEPAEVSGKDTNTLETEMQECMAKRKASQPLSMPNAGSTFKRLEVGCAEMPQQIAPGYYIEQAGLKGYRIGGAEVSTIHANFIVNAGGATAADIKALSEFVQMKVAEKFGIQLKREIILLGEF